MIRIIHLSDFHLENDQLSYRKEGIINALLQDLKTYITKDSLIVFTGDLIDKGGSGFKEPELAYLYFSEFFVNPILSEFGLPKERFLMIAGNHDVQRAKANQYLEQGLRHMLVNQDEINSFIHKNRKSGEDLERIKAYKEFELDFYKGIKGSELSYFDNSFIISLGGTTLGISCFNTSWRCYDNDDEGRLILGEAQLLNSLQFLKKAEHKLALMHHPLTWLLPQDQVIINPIIEKEYDILLFGHTHILEAKLTQGFHGSIFATNAPATIADNPSERRYVNGYSVIDFEKNVKVTSHFRKYVEAAGKFLAYNEVGNDAGIIVYRFPTNEQIEHTKRIDSVINTLREVHVEDLDQDLITYNTDTKAPSSLNDVFVEPTITNIPNPQSVEEDDVITYSINEIIESTDNFLIYGVKEAGKTVFLDKIFIEFINRFYEIKSLPVLISYNEVGNKDFVTVIKNFLAVSSTDCENLLTNENVVLLIDNMNFSEVHRHVINKLKHLVTKYPRIRIIASSEQFSENVIPIDFVEHNPTFKFQLAFIQPLNSKQIKRLIEKWFASGEIDFHDSIEKLINNFITLSLPRTPLSVTLFLWIIEKQERRPINNSVLVQMFVENLLEKANFENIYSETIDFENKQRLLSYLAKYMLDNGDNANGYRLQYSDALDYLQKYLKGRFPADPDRILKNLISRGLLSMSDTSCLRFKSAFLFHYFLAVHMQYNGEFKKYVLHEDRYQEFVDEIEYYTGLERDAVDVLDFTQTQLNAAFGEFNEGLTTMPDDVDGFFETKDMLSAHFTMDRVKVKPTEEQYEQIYDKQIQGIPVKREIAAKQQETNYKSLDKILKLSAIVLKNSEEVDDFDKKLASYTNVIRSSISFLGLYKAYLVNYYLEHKRQPDSLPQNINFDLFIRLLPLAQQIVLFQWMGTPKLRDVVAEKIAKDDNENICEYEQYMSVFMNADIRSPNYPYVIQDFAKKVKRRYIRDSIFLKVMTYYHLRSKDKKFEEIFLNILADIKVRSGHITALQKGDFIKKIHEDKQLRLFNAD